MVNYGILKIAVLVWILKNLFRPGCKACSDLTHSLPPKRPLNANLWKKQALPGDTER